MAVELGSHSGLSREAREAAWFMLCRGRGKIKKVERGQKRPFLG